MKIVASFAILAVSVSSIMHQVESTTPTQERKHSPSSRLRRTKKAAATRSSRGVRDHDDQGGAGAPAKKGTSPHEDDAPKELDRKDDVFGMPLNGMPDGNDLLPDEGFFDYSGDEDVDFFEGFVPPCPPKEALVALNLTAEELGCDATWMPPCPPEKFASRLGGTNETMDCDPNFDFFEELFFYNETELPCPADEELNELEEFFGFNCDPNATLWPNETSWEFFEDFNYTTIECAAPVACDLYGGAASGIVVCSSRYSHGGFFDFDHGAGDDSSNSTDQNWSMCILPNESVDGDVCGCCGGNCPKPCTGSKCKVPNYYNSSSTEVDGVWVADLEYGFAECTTAGGSVTLQLEGYYTCLDTCSS